MSIKDSGMHNNTHINKLLLRIIMLSNKLLQLKRKQHKLMLPKINSRPLRQFHQPSLHLKQLLQPN